MHITASNKVAPIDNAILVNKNKPSNVSLAISTGVGFIFKSLSYQIWENYRSINSLIIIVFGFLIVLLR